MFVSSHNFYYLFILLTTCKIKITTAHVNAISHNLNLVKCTMSQVNNLMHETHNPTFIICCNSQERHKLQSKLYHAAALVNTPILVTHNLSSIKSHGKALAHKLHLKKVKDIHIPSSYFDSYLTRVKTRYVPG